MMLSNRADVEAVDPAFVPIYIAELTTLVNFQLAIVTVLIYDTLCNMDKEVKYFWSSPRKFISIIYFANRYIGIFGSLSLLSWFSLEAYSSMCNFSGWARNVSNWFTIILIDYILMIRVLALYSRDRRMAGLLKALIFLEAISKLGIMIYGTLFQEITVAELAQGVTSCTNVRIVSPLVLLGAIDWAIPLAYGLILMGLALYKAAEFWKMAAGFTGFNLVKILILNQFFYFLLAVSCCVLNIILLQLDVSNIFLAGVLDALGSPTLLCVLGCRILVHLKEAGEAGFNEGTSYRLKTISDMDFA